MTYKEMREMSRMTQQAFSEFFGIPRRTIEDWDSCKSTCKQYLVDLLVYRLNYRDDCEVEQAYYNVKDLRNAAGMTKKAFAEFFEISVKTVDNWEVRGSCADYLIQLMEFKLFCEKRIK